MEDWEPKLLALETRLVGWKQDVEREFERVSKERKLRGLFKKPGAHEVEAALVEAKKRAGIGVLSELTALFDAVCDYYPTVLPQERAKIRARIGSCEVAFELFWSYVDASPEWIKTPEDGAKVVRALVAVAIDDLRANLHLVNDVMTRLVVAATAAGVDWRTHLVAVAKVSNQGTGGGGAHMRGYLEEFERSEHFTKEVAPKLREAAREAMLRGVKSRAS